MLGVIVNTLTVIVGSSFGLLFKKGIPEKITSAIMLGLGLCTLYMGISGALQGENTLILIISMVLGAAIGTLIDLDGKLNQLGELVTARVQKKQAKEKASVSLTDGFVTACLLFCIGPMTIVGSLKAGMSGDYEMLFTKSLLDMISSSMLSVSLGLGVLLSSVFVLIFQGGLVMLAQVLAPFLTETAIAELSCVGSLIIVAIGLNMIGITKIKVADYLPSIIIAPILCNILTWF